MNKTEAIAALHKLYGKKAAYRRDEGALVGEERAAVLASIPELNAASKAAFEAMKVRREELLKDPEYLRLREAHRLAEKAASHARAHYHIRRVTVGYIDDGPLRLFSVKGEGDNWHEAVEAARKTVKP